MVSLGGAELGERGCKKAYWCFWRGFTQNPKMSGATDDREGLKKLLGRAERDDIIICTKMDRLGRNTADMINIVDRCYKHGIAIKFLENGLSTEGTMGKMVIQILAAVAEAERERILERTNDGRKLALAAGVKFGRKPHKGTDVAVKLINQGTSSKEVMNESRISRATYFRLKKLHKKWS